MLEINEIKNIVSEFNEGYLSNLEKLKDDFENHHQNDIESSISEKYENIFVLNLKTKIIL